MNDSKMAYSKAEAAQVLSVSKWTVHQEIKRGNIQVVRFGRRVVIPRWALEERLTDA